MKMIKELYSRRNNVMVFDIDGQLAVIKQFDNMASCNNEMNIYQQYGDNMPYLPQLIDSGNSVITKQYVGDSTLLDMVEQCEQCGDSETLYALLCQAIYIMVHFYNTTDMILRDVSLDNFVVGDRVYFVDTEQADKGDLADDVAMFLALFTTRKPSNTSYKLRIYGQLVQYIASIDMHLLSNVLHIYSDKLGMLDKKHTKR